MERPNRNRLAALTTKPLPAYLLQQLLAHKQLCKLSPLRIVPQVLVKTGDSGGG